MHTPGRCGLYSLFVLSAVLVVGCGDDNKSTAPEVAALDALGRLSLSSPTLAVDVLNNFAYVAASQAGLVINNL